MHGKPPKLAYRPAFEAALRIFARVSEEMKALGFLPPVLVGGAAVEIYSNSEINTGDFDIVTARQDALEEVLRRHGFVRPSGPGKALRGWIHPDISLGFEVVADRLLDGNADRARITLIDMGADGEVAIISVEDMIADRVGQYASGTAPEMLEQARRLFILHADTDLHYMEVRIRQESADDYGVADLQA